MRPSRTRGVTVDHTTSPSAASTQAGKALRVADVPLAAALRSTGVD
jgi:hypothetical protein